MKSGEISHYLVRYVSKRDAWWIECDASFVPRQGEVVKVQKGFDESIEPAEYRVANVRWIFESVEQDEEFQWPNERRLVAHVELVDKSLENNVELG